MTKVIDENIVFNKDVVFKGDITIDVKANLTVLGTMTVIDTKIQEHYIPIDIEIGQEELEALIKENKQQKETIEYLEGEIEDLIPY